MAEAQDDDDVAAAIRELAKQVDALGNAVITAADRIAKAIGEGINVSVGKQPGPWTRVPQLVGALGAGFVRGR